jgi:hypothetical protein
MQAILKEFGDQLQPSRTPKDIRYYKNENGSVKGELPMRAGNGQDTWFLIQVLRTTFQTSGQYGSFVILQTFHMHGRVVVFLHQMNPQLLRIYATMSRLDCEPKRHPRRTFPDSAATGGSVA